MHGFVFSAITSYKLINVMIKRQATIMAFKTGGLSTNQDPDAASVDTMKSMASIARLVQVDKIFPPGYEGWIEIAECLPTIAFSLGFAAGNNFWEISEPGRKDKKLIVVSVALEMLLAVYVKLPLPQGTSSPHSACT